MKSFLLAVLCLLTPPALAQMQPTMPTKAELAAADGTAPVKGTNTIVLATADSVNVAWRTIRQMLLSKGFSLAQNDEGLHSFTTAPKAIPSNRQLTITGFVQAAADGKTEILLSGSYSYVTVLLFSYNAATLTRPLVWEGGALGEDTAMFKLMQAVALAYPRLGMPLRYTAR